MASSTTTSPYIALAGKRIIVTNVTADRLLTGKDNPVADPWAAGVYSALTAAATIAAGRTGGAHEKIIRRLAAASS